MLQSERRDSSTDVTYGEDVVHIGLDQFYQIRNSENLDEGVVGLWQVHMYRGQLEDSWRLREYLATGRASTFEKNTLPRQSVKKHKCIEMFVKTEK